MSYLIAVSFGVAIILLLVSILVTYMKWSGKLEDEDGAVGDLIHLSGVLFIVYGILNHFF